MIQTLPNLQLLLDGRVGVGQIRSLEVEDLLTRASVPLDNGPVKDLITGRRVLVTGAGRVDRVRAVPAAREFLQPSRLVLYERYENGLYAIATELADQRMGETGGCPVRC